MRRALTAAVVIGAACVCLVAVMAAQAAPTKSYVIGYVTKSATNQGWILINSGAADAAKQAHVKLITVGPAQAESLSGQLSAIEDMINRHVDALLIAPVDSAGVAPAVRKAMTAHIPVIAVDTAVTGAKVTSFVATQNLAAANDQAKWLAAKLPSSGSIILVNGYLAQSTGRERHDGFLSVFKKLRPGVKVYEVQTQWDKTQAQNGIETLLRAHPDVSAIVNAWDDATMAAVAALKNANVSAGKVTVVGFDGAPNALQAMKDGWVQADIAQMLYGEGSKGLNAAIQAAQGKKVPARIDTGHFVVTPSNVDAFIKKNHLKRFMPH
jgi:ribose transport system substrate-binding protein